MRTVEDWRDDWNDLTIKTIAENTHTNPKDSADYLNGKMADYCEEIMVEAQKAYHVIGEPTMHDDWYNSLEMRLKSLRPESKILEKVG